MSDTAVKFKWTSSVKIGKQCPSRIVITTAINGHVHVTFTRTHIGHTQSIRFLRLTSNERDELAGKLRIGVTPDRILDDIRESVSSLENMSRLHIVDKKDLHNIIRDYKLDRDVAHKNDAFSVSMWVQQQMTLKEDSPVLYFKPQGEEDGGRLLNEDFMIVLMTSYQREVVVEYASDKVCVDSTHKTTDHDFQLTTLVTVDEFGAGCPIASCLSNRVDFIAMSRFFESVKDKAGKITAETFMSDDAPAYINAWTDVMSPPKHHLLCNWHVDQNWRNNLNKIKDPIKQSEVYKACRMLMECLDEETFHTSLAAFLQMCEEDPDTQNFGKYFGKHYAGHPEKWAFSYRIGLSLNTNMFLEALHKKLKYIYMNGQQNRRVDKCIGYLMRFSRDMMIERVIRMVKNKPTYRMQLIGHSHRKSEQINDTMIENIDETTWLVQSSTLGRGPYTVSLDNSFKCNNCPLSCPKCKVCVHRFTCTCVDHQIKGNFCKHSHACIRVSGSNYSISRNEKDVTAEFQDHSDKVLQALQEQPVHINDSVSLLTRVETLLSK